MAGLSDRRVRRRRGRRGLPARRAASPARGGGCSSTLAAARRRRSIALLARAVARRSRSLFLAVAGFGYLASNTSATSRLQLEVAEHQRGRIMALWSVAFLGLRPIASLTDGAIAGAFGVRAPGVVLAAARALAARGPAIYFLQRHHRSAYEAGVAFRRMELHFIADDLEEHAWYVDLVGRLRRGRRGASPPVALRRAKSPTSSETRRVA